MSNSYDQIYFLSASIMSLSHICLIYTAWYILLDMSCDLISFIMSCVWVQFSFSYSASLATNGLCWVCNMCKIACSCIKTSSNGICNHYFFTNIASFWDLASISKISRVTSPLWATLPKCLFWVKIN